jgi:hypothetical protein
MLNFFLSAAGHAAAEMTLTRRAVAARRLKAGARLWQPRDKDNETVRGIGRKAKTSAEAGGETRVWSEGSWQE